VSQTQRALGVMDEILPFFANHPRMMDACLIAIFTEVLNQLQEGGADDAGGPSVDCCLNLGEHAVRWAALLPLENRNALIVGVVKYFNTRVTPLLRTQQLDASHFKAQFRLKAALNGLDFSGTPFGEFV